MLEGESATAAWKEPLTTCAPCAGEGAGGRAKTSSCELRMELTLLCLSRRGRALSSPPGPMRGGLGRSKESGRVVMSTSLKLRGGWKEGVEKRSSKRSPWRSMEWS